MPKINISAIKKNETFKKQQRYSQSHFLYELHCTWFLRKLWLDKNNDPSNKVKLETLYIKLMSNMNIWIK
jgi:hypothetical protein